MSPLGARPPGSAAGMSGAINALWASVKTLGSAARAARCFRLAMPEYTTKWPSHTPSELHLVVFGIQQPVQLSPAGFHAFGHFDLGEPFLENPQRRTLGVGSLS
jgi:hypothetical protein